MVIGIPIALIAARSDAPSPRCSLTPRDGAETKFGCSEMIQIWMLGLLRCDRHHEMSDWVPAVIRVTAAAKALRKHGSTSDLHGLFASWVEKIMSPPLQCANYETTSYKKVSGGSCCAGSHFPAVKLNGRIPGATAPEGEVKF